MSIAQISKNIFSLGLQRLIVDKGITFILITFKFDLLLNNAYYLSLLPPPSVCVYFREIYGDPKFMLLMLFVLLIVCSPCF